jgi:glutathione S-transferase
VGLGVSGIDDEQHGPQLCSAAMTAVLYAIPASHPSAVVERALQLKGVPYRRVERIPVLHRPVQRLRFPAGSVPGIEFADGERVTGSRAILRALEARVPTPALVPAEEEQARAEEWGDEVLQPLARRIVWAAVKRRPGQMMRYADGAELPVPRWFARVSAPLVSWLAARLNRAGDAPVRADLLALPAHLDRVDRWIANGALGGAQVNAADLQVASSLRLLLTVADVAPLIDARPAGALARRVFPEYPGAVPAGVLPAGWVPGSANVNGGH